MMRGAVLDKLFNGPESFSPDCKWVLGQASEVDNYFVATGMKSLGIASAGGVAKYLAEWRQGKARCDQVATSTKSEQSQAGAQVVRDGAPRTRP